MSGFVCVDRYTFKMTISEQDILRTLMKSRDRIAAAAWVVVRDYLLGGQSVAQLDDDELSSIRGARIGFIFQSFNLIAQLNVIENIEIPMYYQGYSKQQSADRALELAGLVGLADRVDHRPSELSGGQQQRVAIARALGNDPLIILADEPTGNLDSASGADILAILDRLHSEGKTLIVVTHDEHIAAKAERVIQLFDGRSQEKSKC
ncbi:MAG: ATP-binding cassette domain-containing protein [Sedimentisphaerales bacterium]